MTKPRTEARLAAGKVHCAMSKSSHWLFCLSAECTARRERVSATGAGPCDGCGRDAPLIHVGPRKTPAQLPHGVLICEDCAQLVLF